MLQERACSGCSGLSIADVYSCGSATCCKPFWSLAYCCFVCMREGRNSLCKRVQSSCLVCCQQLLGLLQLLQGRLDGPGCA